MTGLVVSVGGRFLDVVVTVEKRSCGAEFVTVAVVLFEVGFKLDKVAVAGVGVHDGNTADVVAAAAVTPVSLLASMGVMDVVSLD